MNLAMAEPAEDVSLMIVRRNRKGALTRSLKSLDALMAAEAETKTIEEMFGKAKRQWEAVELAHQELVDTLVEQEAYEAEELWMMRAEAEFLEARVKMEKHLVRSVKNNGIIVEDDHDHDDSMVPSDVAGTVEAEIEHSVQVNASQAEPTINEGSNAVASNSTSSIEADRVQLNQVISAVQNVKVEPLGSNEVQIGGSNAASVDSHSALGELKLALELPKAEILEFNGDAIKYWSFVKNFDVNVSSKLSNNSTRLQYLLQLCKGKARSCIESCALLGGAGYDRARAILKRNFGQPHLILNALMSDLTSRKAIRPHDGGALRDLISCMQTCHVTLTQMGYVTDLNSTGNLLRVQSLLPIYMQNSWAKVAQGILNTREPTFLDLLTFLEGQAEIACNMFGKSISLNKISAGKANDEKPKAKSNYVKANAKIVKCFACDGEHRLFDCQSFARMSHEERLQVVREKRLCFRCLFPGHSIARCRRESTCSSCKSNKHHVLLHAYNSDSSNLSVNSNAAICGSQVFLRILPVKVTGTNGNQVSTLALLDSGSDTSLCSEDLRKDLGISGKSVSYTSSTINGDESRLGSLFDLLVQGKDEPDSINITCLSVSDFPNGGESVPQSRELHKWDHLRSISWGDVSHMKLGLLIGADSPEAFWIREERRGRPKDPYAIRTLLGWSVMGPGGLSGNPKRVFNNRISCCPNSDILDYLKKSWSIEDPVYGEGESVEDAKAKAIMDSTVTQEKDGHYQLGLLWKDSNLCLPTNRSLEETRLSSLKRKLEKNEELLHQYAQTMDGYIEQGYAEPVTTEGQPGRTWYLPHHPVVHPQKGKLRVVFDCAAKWKGTSLNDCLMKGPDTINNLVGVLLRFRQERVALVADVEAMFHQARVIPEDRDALRFLWWPGGKLNSPPREFRMAVHLFGASSSPACAGYALRRAAYDSQSKNHDAVGKQVVQAIKDDFYVDDLLTSTCREDVAVEFVERLRETLKQGGFRLTKWLSNSRYVLDSVPASERAPTVTNLEKLPTERTLGVSWDAEVDMFKFQVSLQDKPFTKRGLLSTASQIFDPLGFSAPFILIARSLLQSVCRKGSNWDKQLASDELGKWKEWLRQVPSLSSIKIPRWIRLDEASSVQLHIFCDASEVGYSAVAYLRVVDSDNVVRCVFVLGKARVSPMKAVSIPRLELMAAVLATTLNSIITTELRFRLGECTYWTDSMIVLGYIRNETRRFKTFVANRVSRIRSVSSPQQWRHVGTKQNPADDGSRGTSDLARWLSGPDFLLKEKDEWPVLTEGIDVPTDPEVKVPVSTFHTLIVPSFDILTPLIDRFSSLNVLVRVFAWVRRFINNCRHLEPVTTGGLSVSELEMSETIITSFSQKSEFGSWKSDQRLVKLKPVLLNELRVGGRLDNSELDFNAKHPIIIPPKGPLTDLIVRHYHESVGHGGLSLTLNAIRQKFWVLNGRTVVKRALSKCVRCRKLLARPAQQVMATLPSERVSSDKPPFCYVGIDYFGPIEVKRARSIVKRYGCIFTCLASRAVHLEVSASLDTDSFLNAYRRFIARRGQPEKVFSDNGTNFHAGEKELRQALKSMNNDKIEPFFHSKGCEWVFNPPSASHYGGAWERLIRSVRRILHGILGQQTVNEEVLTTVFAEVESILNSRPLTDVSFDPRDEDPITPNHLILLRQGPSAPVSQEQSKSYGRRRWLQVQHLASTFWLRWRREYLPLLQKRQKWTTPKDNVMVGDIVLLTDETVPRGKWPLGKVVTVRRSADERVRSVEVKVKGKLLRRPITKLCIVYRSELAM